MAGRRALVVGAGGRAGAAIADALAVRGWDVTRARRRDLDLVGVTAPGEVLANARADLVVNAAGWTDVDGCQTDPGRAWAVNADAVGRLGEASRATGAHLIHLSTDYVFGGEL